MPNRFAADVISALVLRCPIAASLTPAAAAIPSVQCTWTGPVRDLAAHPASCAAAEVACVWPLCKTRMPRGSLAAHITSCGSRAEICPHCSEVQRGNAAITAHAAVCAAKPVLCSHTGCLQSVARSAMAAHLDGCAFKRVPCGVLGCGVLVARNAMTSHMASAAVAHMQTLTRRVLALTARLDATEAELRRFTGRAPAVPRAKRTKR